MSTRTRTARLFAAAVSAAVAGLAAAPAARGAAYTLTGLGFTNGLDNYGQGTDANGRILIAYADANGKNQAALLANGVTTPVAGLAGYFSTTPTAISSNGTYVTGYRRSADAAPSTPFLYNGSSGTAATLPTLGGSQAIASSVNDAGVAVGNSNLAGDTLFVPVIYAAGATTALPFLPGGTVGTALGINNAGLIVGNSVKAQADPNDPDYYHATAWTLATPTSAYAARDLGSLAGVDGFIQAVGVNANGLVVGETDHARFGQQRRPGGRAVSP